MRNKVAKRLRAMANDPTLQPELRRKNYQQLKKEYTMSDDKSELVDPTKIELNKKALKDQEKEIAKDEKKQAEKDEGEKTVDNEVAIRTSRYDQDLKERARTYGINPDNFGTEEALGATVKKYEDDNNILGTPEERDQ